MPRIVEAVELIKKFEKQIQLLAAETDLKKSLQKQFDSFQKVRSHNS